MDFITHLSQNISPSLIYILVGAFLLLESAGIPVINSTLLLFAGAVSFEGHLDLVLLIIIAILGSVLGACCSYYLGRRYGEPLLLRLARLLRIDERKVLLAERWFRSAGIRMVFLSRIVPYIRPFACFPAGILHMPFRRFFWSVLAGSVVWCVTMLVVGWELGPRWRVALHLVQVYTLPAIGVLLLLAIASFFARRALNKYMERHLNEAAEQLERDHDLLEV